MIQQITGNLIEMAQDSHFDVITHGCNCFCTMGTGIALGMKHRFGCNDPELFKLESPKHAGNINKLGCIEDREVEIVKWFDAGLQHELVKLVVINSYTQYYYGQKGYQFGRYNIPLDYDALALCLRKINHKYSGKHIGMPPIGATHGGGEWKKILGIITTELKDMNVTIVKLP